MKNDWNRNHILLRGTPAGPAAFSHQTRGTDFFRMPLSVPRLSGTADRVELLLPAPLLADCPSDPETPVQVEGEVRSFNNRSGIGHRLVISVLAQYISPTEEPPVNQLELAGMLCKPPVLRTTPLGRDICDLLLAVNRRYGRADYLPCIAWGSLSLVCSRMQVGDPLHLHGRLQSRTYRKLVEGVYEEKTAFEVSIMHLETSETVFGEEELR